MSGVRVLLFGPIGLPLVIIRWLSQLVPHNKFLKQEERDRAFFIQVPFFCSREKIFRSSPRDLPFHISLAAQGHVFSSVTVHAQDGGH